MSRLASIIERRKGAIVAAWVRDPQIQVQAEGPGSLPNLVFLDDRGATGTASQLGRRAATSVAVVRRPGNPDTDASVWVAARYPSYRSAYLAFVRAMYGIEATTDDLLGYDIDHMLNRARSPQNDSFIRIEAVDRGANQAWGRLFEKTASDGRFYANQSRKRRTMSWMICAKLAGQMPPEGPHDRLGIERLVTYFRGVGLSEAETRSGLDSLLQFTYRLRDQRD
jgi:hypothetical protein